MKLHEEIEKEADNFYDSAQGYGLTSDIDTADILYYYAEKVKKIEQQIEKMKCCYNCNNTDCYDYENEEKRCKLNKIWHDFDYKCDKWELEE